MHDQSKDGGKHEGRGSWTFARYLADTDYAGKTNAFWDKIKGRLDFQKYCETNGYEGIDYFEEILREKHIPHEFHINPGKHDQAYWQAHVGEYLRWYAAGWEGRSSTVDK